jgi:hypothetical protein
VQKQKIDQEKEIEDEIQKELERSRVRRTESKADKEKRNVITHHPRYIESTREREKEVIDPYYRGATYDVVNRNINQYPEVDDSYVIQTKPERVERFAERNYNPPVSDADTRVQARSPLRKSAVNPQYRDEYNVAPGESRVGSGYRQDAAGYGSGRNAPRPTSGERYVDGGYAGEGYPAGNPGRGYSSTNYPGGAQRANPGSQYQQRREPEYDDYDSEQDDRARSLGSTHNLKKEILDKKMKQERDNRRIDDDFY